MKKILFIPIIFILLLLNCKKGELTPVETIIDPSDAKAVAKVLIMPDGTQTSAGNPPSSSSDTKAPKVTVQQGTIATQNGNSESLGFQYSNVNGGVRSVYVQVEGADTYYTVPVNNPNINGSGRIALPISFPLTLGSGNFSMGYCVVDYSGRVSNVIRTGFNVTRIAPINPAVGSGSFVVNGQTFNGKALCDVGKQYGNANYLDVDFIFLDNGQGVFLYNIKNGSNVLTDPLNTNNFSVERDPWIAYLGPSSNFFYPKSGTATKSGNKVSFSSIMYDVSSGSSLSIRGAINCQ